MLWHNAAFTLWLHRRDVNPRFQSFQSENGAKLSQCTWFKRCRNIKLYEEWIFNACRRHIDIPDFTVKIHCIESSSSKLGATLTVVSNDSRGRNPPYGVPKSIRGPVNSNYPSMVATVTQYCRAVRLWISPFAKDRYSGANWQKDCVAFAFAKPPQTRQSTCKGWNALLTALPSKNRVLLCYLHIFKSGTYIHLAQNWHLSMQISFIAVPLHKGQR